MLGQVERILAPLNFKALRKVGPRMGELANLNPGAGIPLEAQDLVLEIVLASLRRNYPEMTQDEVEEGLDLANIQPIMLAILRGSGLKERATPGEAPAP